MDFCASAFGLTAGGCAVPTDANRIGSRMRCADILDSVFDQHNIEDEDRAALEIAVLAFFRSRDPDVAKFVAHLADSTFNLLALCIDEESRETLQSSLPEAKIFVDTNILFALLGTHDTPLAAAPSTASVIHQNKLPDRLYYDPKTLAELTHCGENSAFRLTRHEWSRQVSRALLDLPWQVARLSGTRCPSTRSTQNSLSTPKHFVARYSSPATLLADHGVQIYRTVGVPEPQERLELRSTIIADYKDFLSKNPRRRNTHYSKLDHDATIRCSQRIIRFRLGKGHCVQERSSLRAITGVFRFHRTS